MKNLKVRKDSLNKQVEDLEEDIWKASNEIAIQWIPSHVGIEGNEKPAVEANTVRELDQGSIEICHKIIK